MVCPWVFFHSYYMMPILSKLQGKIVHRQDRWWFKWVPCHYGISRPQVAGWGEGLQIWRVAANILNKQLQTATRAGPPVCGLGGELTTPHCKTQHVNKILNRASDLVV
jgi:hypothetical protein